MTRADAWSFHTSNALVSLTGLALFWMVYGLTPEDPEAVAFHPAQPAMQHAHVLAAPILTFILGHLWVRHGWSHRSAGTHKGRRSGTILLAMAAPMILSGYLLQIAVTPLARTAWSWTHAATSVLWLAGCIGHTLRHWMTRRPPPA